MTQDIKELLKAGMKALGLNFPGEKIIEYLALLNKWNRVYNLTAIRDVPAMVTRHALDSLAILPWIKGARLLDVGSGAGLPGIPLAIARPDWHVTLLDSNGKKIRFLQEVKVSLALENIELVHRRVENYQPAQLFDTVTSRAFADLPHMLQWTRHLVAKDGIWLAMKGCSPEEELAAIKLPYQVERYTVPGIDDEQRCCVIITNSD